MRAFDLKRRFIALKDDDGEMIVETNAPKELIKEAIEYKNDCRLKMVKDCESDIELIQNYIMLKGYEFDTISVNEFYRW